MGIFNFRKDKETEVVQSSIDNRTEPIVQGDNYKVDGIEYRAPTIFGVDLYTWINAVDAFYSETQPDRIDLAYVYKALSTYDAQVISTINTRKLKAIQGDMAFYKANGEIDEKATALIKSSSGATQRWFANLMDYIMDSIFWGFELVTINYINGKLTVKKIPEQNVIPQEGYVLYDVNKFNSDGNHVSFVEGPLDIISIKISRNDDLNDIGLLGGVAPYVFNKRLSVWSQHADKYGIPYRYFKGDSTQTRKMQGIQRAFMNQGREPFFVIGENDEIVFDRPNSDSSIYENLEKVCNDAISKIILGQTSTTDEKAYAGSAQVHKSILDSITIHDREFIETIVNDQLVPKLQMFGLLEPGITFGISESIEEDLLEKAQIIKILTDSGYKIDSKYIEKTFDMPIVDIINNINENKENTNGKN